jgi:exocyst complex component 2
MGRSGFGQLNGASPAAQKNSLTKEAEYGVRGIRGPLVEASARAEEVWGEALGGRQREEGLKAVVDAMERQRKIYEIGAELTRSIKQRNYEEIAEQYAAARRYANDAKVIADRAMSANKSLTDDQVHTLIVTARMWVDVEHQVESFKRDLWRRLSSVHMPTAASPGGHGDEYMELISMLLELGVEDNPVWVWLLSRYDYLKTRITSFCERSVVEIEILRRRLANGEKPTPQAMLPYLRLPIREGVVRTPEELDTDAVVELWECVHTYLKKLIALKGGLLGDVTEFWDTAQSFIDGGKQKVLPAGFAGESRKHHRLSVGGVGALRDGVIELVNLIRQNVVSLFADPPTEDISLLFSPISPTSPNTPFSALTPTESRFKLDPKELPPPSPKTGEAWEGFAFWPPYSNSISAVEYLSKFLILIGTAASEMSALGPISSGGAAYDKLKLLVSVARERSVRAVCAAWSKDAEICKYLEDWTRDPERRELTKMPTYFMAFEGAVLGGMQKILYISEAMTKPGVVDVVTPPPAKLLQMVRGQFVTSVYKSLSGLVENAEHPVRVEGDDEWVKARSASALPGAGGLSANSGLDSRNRVSLPPKTKEVFLRANLRCDRMSACSLRCPT